MGVFFMQSWKGLYATKVMSTTSVARWGMLRAHPVDEEESINSGSGRKNQGEAKARQFFRETTTWHRR